MLLSRVIRKPAFCICENKAADQLRGNQVCVGPGRKPRRPVFSRRGSIIKLDSKKKDPVIIELQHNKTYFYICKNKGADQLRSGNHAADRRLRFHYILNPKFRPLLLQLTVSDLVKKVQHILKGKSFATILHPIFLQYGPCEDILMIISYVPAQ